MKKNTEESEKRIVDSLGARIENIEKRQTELEQRVIALETQQSSSSNGDAASFVPTYIEIKNFCEYEERLTKGVTRPEAVQVYEKLKNQVPEVIRPFIGEIGLKGPRNLKMKIPVSKNWRIFRIGGS